MNKELIFKIQHQLKDNWCWAANAASISKFYDPASSWTQCGVACDVLMRSDCCVSLTPHPCDIPYFFDKALTSTHNFLAPVMPIALSKNDIMKEIDSERIIGVRIGWHSSGGHFVSIHGYNDTTNGFFIYVADPIYGNSISILSNFINNYQSAGSWTHSYFTRRSTVVGGGMIKLTPINENLIAQASRVLESLDPEKKIILTENIQKQSYLLKPHELYNIPFDSLKGGHPNFVKSGFRLINEGEGKRRQILEFTDNSANANLSQVIHNSPLLEQYERELDNISKSQKVINDVYELRIIRQPELKVEAFWLHNEQHPSTDRFIPLISMSITKVGENYSRDNFLNILVEAARRRNENSNDLLGG